MAKRNPANPPPAEEIVCGFHGVRALLAAGSAAVWEVLLDHRRHDLRMKQLRRDLETAEIRFRPVAKEELERLSRGVKHQGVIARIRPRIHATPAGKPHPGEPDWFQLLERAPNEPGHPPLLLILDRVQDPHNLGACLRTADGAGADAVILPKDGACPLSPAVTRVAAGAVGRVPVCYVANLARSMAALQQRGIWLIGADETADLTLYQMDFTAASAIVMGAEGRGLRRLTRQGCDRLARIPMSGGVASLNVSVAAALFLYEAVRQRSGA